MSYRNRLDVKGVFYHVPDDNVPVVLGVSVVTGNIFVTLKGDYKIRKKGKLLFKISSHFSLWALSGTATLPVKVTEA